MRRSLLGAVLLLSPLAAPQATAHAIGAECKIRNNRVEVEAYFSDDTPAADAKVVVKNVDGGPIADGKTDAEGRWSFAKPAAGRYEVVVDAGAGHRTTVSVTIAPADLSTADLLTDAPTRSDFTRIPWGRIVFGLGLIAIASIAAVRLLRRTRQSKAPLP